MIACWLFVVAEELNSGFVNLFRNLKEQKSGFFIFCS